MLSVVQDMSVRGMVPDYGQRTGIGLLQQAVDTVSRSVSVSFPLPIGGDIWGKIEIVIFCGAWKIGNEKIL